MTTLSSNLSLSVASVVAVVGAFDAYIGGEWDFFVIFVIISLLLLVVWLRQRAPRVPMTVRSDLAQWLQHRADTSGEPIEDIVDRALSTYRMGLVGEVQS